MTQANVKGRSLPVAMIAAMRPRQWAKNVLVFAAPLAAGQLFEVDIFWPSVGAFAMFCVISSATYLINDIKDRDSDREHPSKCKRPIAAGELSVPLAISFAVVLAVIALVGSYAIAPALAAVVLAYAVFTVSYSMALKHEPVIELALLSMGFLLRAVAGGAASDLPISQWFLIVAGFGSLFMAAGKRFSELKREEIAGSPLGNRRKSLEGYPLSYLRFVWGTAAAVTIMGYALWAFDVAQTPSSLAWAEWSVLPFVLAILRYGIVIDQGDAEAPEEAVTADKALLLLGAAWLILFAMGALGV